MRGKLPDGDFEWVKGEDLSIDKTMKYNEDTNDIAYV
jgi:hypothetical protein